MKPRIILAEDGSPAPEANEVILGSNGVFCRRSLGFADALVPALNVPGLDRVQPWLAFNWPKIELRHLEISRAFFARIFQLHQGEGMLYLGYKRDEARYDVFCSSQEVDAASVEADPMPRQRGWRAVGTIHSHAGMLAGHSSIDSADEQGFNGIHITLGNLGLPVGTLSCSVVIDGYRFVVDPSQLVEDITPRKRMVDKQILLPPPKQYGPKQFAGLRIKGSQNGLSRPAKPEFVPCYDLRSEAAAKDARLSGWLRLVSKAKPVKGTVSVTFGYLDDEE